MQQELKLNLGGIHMKSTGIVRPLDPLGRITIPIELRRTLDISDKDSLEVFVEGEQIILRKYQPGCILCGEAEKLTWYKGKYFCKTCVDEFMKK
jgi:transcriptional pleiotropic regulator of transition state genes